jgi:hypothetical protein
MWPSRVYGRTLRARLHLSARKRRAHWERTVFANDAPSELRVAAMISDGKL